MPASLLSTEVSTPSILAKIQQSCKRFISQQGSLHARTVTKNRLAAKTAASRFFRVHYTVLMN